MFTQSLNAKQLSHYQVTGPDYVVTFIESPDELATLTGPLTVVGAGTNRLWINRQSTTLVSLKQLSKITFQDDGTIRVEAGATLPALIKAAKEKGLGGLEFTWPISATLGGALAQNFGAYNTHLGSFVRSMNVYDPSTNKIKTVRIKQEADWFSYRYSRIKADNLTLIEATLQLEPLDPSDIQADLDAIQKQRASRYQLHHTCGSVFKNPPDVAAGKLIDDCGLKGFRMGPVQTAQGHANVIIADKDATTQDIYDLVGYLQKTVLAKTGVQLELELSVY